MKNVKKSIFIVLCTMFILGLSGCSKTDEELQRAQELYDNKEYQEVIDLIKGRKDKEAKDLLNKSYYYVGEKRMKIGAYEAAASYYEHSDYKDAKEKLAQANELIPANSACYNIKKSYDDMIAEMDAENEGKSIDDHFTEGSHYYMNIGLKLNTLLDRINSGVSLEEISTNCDDIFGKTFNSIDEVKNAITTMQQYVIWDLNKNRLYPLMDVINNNSNCTVEINDTYGLQTINRPDLFLNENNMSEQTFAQLLGIFKDYGAEIGRDKEKLTIKWSSSTRGYYDCVAFDEELDTALRNAVNGFRFENQSINSNILTGEMVFNYNGTSDLKWFVCWLYHYEADGDYVDQQFIVRENISANSEIRINISAPSNASNFEYQITALKV